MVKRRVAWAEKNLDILLMSEFEYDDSNEIDLEISVYEIEEIERTRAHAEHQAGSNLGPSPCVQVDLTHALANPLQTPGTTGFQFTTNRHRDIRPSLEGLKVILVEVLAELDARQKKSEKPSIGDYVASRVESEDEEWLGFLEHRC